MESYVLRVYRREGARLVGTVEETIKGHQSSFHSAEDLWRVLAGSTRKTADTRGPQLGGLATPSPTAGRKKARTSPLSRIAARKAHAQRRIE